MQPKQCIAIIDSIKAYAKQNPTEAQVYEDWFQAVVNLRDALPQDKRFDAYKYSGELRSVCAAMMGKMKTGEDVAKVYDIIGRTYLFEAKDVFDSYCIYLEWNRAPEKKFYQPRRKVLLTLVRDLEDLFFHRVEFLGVSQPPRTGKSTLCIFFITWLMGNRPDVASVMSGHSDKLTNGFYGEVLSIITDPVTYNWGKIFPDVQLVDKSAKDESVDLNRKKRFPTLTCRSIGGTLTGAVEIGEGGVLYSDDLIEDLEESLNVERLNNKYDAYLNQLKDRKKQGALELMVGTRWNVLDPLGRIQNQYADNPKYRFRVIPAVDENGHSNFNYDYGVGFDDAYYADMKASIDDATWWAKYMGKPYVREGLLFPADELRYFNGVLPDGEPDRKLMVMDIAWGGGDFTACPIAYVYGDAVFIPDLVFNNGDKTVTRPEVVGKIIQHKINVVRGEANNGGDEYCDVVDSQLRQQGYHCSVRSQRAPSGQSKLSRIIQYAPDIKRFYFLDEKHQSKEYKAFMEQVTMFTQLGKVPHDDAPDTLPAETELTSGFDTGLKLLEHASTESPQYTILVDAKAGDNFDASTWPAFLHCLTETGSTANLPGFNSTSSPLNNKTEFAYYNYGGVTLSDSIEHLKTRTRYVVQLDGKKYRGGSTYCPMTEWLTCNGTITDVPQTFLIGAAQSADGSKKQQFWPGTLYQCKVYKGLLSDNRIKAYINKGW